MRSWICLTLLVIFAPVAWPAESGEAKSAADLLRDQVGAALPEALRGVLSEAEEAEAGRTVAASLLAVAPLVKDDGLQRYVNEIGGWVAAQSERPDLHWHFGVVDTGDLNAFAIPGGYVLLTAGLYDTLDDPSALAGVLAHEIAHVVARHHLKLAIGSKIIDEGFRRAGAELDAVSRTRRLIGAGASLLARKLDQQSEFDADRMAIVLAARAGFDPWGLPSVLAQLARHKVDDDRLALLFSTHPLPSDRLRQLGEVMGEALAPYASPEAGGRLYERGVSR
jgi:predicted Zn-dependent protease